MGSCFISRKGVVVVRACGRLSDELRDLKISRSVLRHPEGSAQIDLGFTRVICTATIEDRVPSFLRGSGQGWVTAEYAMLPRSTLVRVNRERGVASARSLEIQRLIGRALRVVTDCAILGEKTIRIDCDVIQADGGTRTAAVSGAFIAMADAFLRLRKAGALAEPPLHDYVAAVSVGLLEETPFLDLDYNEDSSADVDLNIVMTPGGELVEVQGSAERKPFSLQQLESMIALAATGVQVIAACQSRVLGQDAALLFKSKIFGI